MAIAPVEGLSASVKGRIVDRGDAAYDDSRALYNGMIDKHPAAIAYCVDEADVSAAVTFATDRDLQIAVRCGGNFGVVTSFRFRCHDVGTVEAGPVLYDLGDAADVLRWYREFMPAQPDELNGFFAFLSIPPGPPFPEELHLRPVCAVVWCHTGASDSPALREARSFGTPLVDGIAPVPLPAWNSAFDGVYPPGDQWYWRGEFMREIPDAAIEQRVA